MVVVVVVVAQAAVVALSATWVASLSRARLHAAVGGRCRLGEKTAERGRPPLLDLLSVSACEGVTLPYLQVAKRSAALNCQPAPNGTRNDDEVTEPTQNEKSVPSPAGVLCPDDRVVHDAGTAHTAKTTSPN